MEVLMRGDINLYFRSKLNRSDNATFYFNERGGSYTRLYKFQKVINSEGREFVMRYEPYRKILADYLDSCYLLKKKTDYLSSTRLIEVFKSSASCKGLKESFVRGKVPSSIYLTPLLGVSVWNVQFSNTALSSLNTDFNGTIKTTVAPMVGAELELFFPRRPINFAFGLVYSYFDYKGDSIYHALSFSTSKATISRSFVSSYLSGKYAVPLTRHVHTEIEVGFGLINPITSKYRRVLVDNDKVTTNTTYAFSKHSGNMFLGLSVWYDKLGFYLRWTSFTSPNTLYVYVSDKVSGYNMGIRYRIRLPESKNKS